MSSGSDSADFDDLNTVLHSHHAFVRARAHHLSEKGLIQWDEATFAWVPTQAGAALMARMAKQER